MTGKEIVNMEYSFYWLNLQMDCKAFLESV